MSSASTPLYKQVYPTSEMHQMENSMIPTPPTLLQSSKVLVGPDSTRTTCLACHAAIKTAVRYTTTTRTHFLALCALLCCCCCIPYSCASARNSDHYCPNCGEFLGTYVK